MDPNINPEELNSSETNNSEISEQEISDMNPIPQEQDVKMVKQEESDSQSPVEDDKIESEENLKAPVTMFVRVNQVVTSLISGVFASLIILLASIGVSKAGLVLDTGEGAVGFQVLVVSLVLFALGVTISQCLDSYLSKLVERDNFEKIGFKVFKNISSQLILLILSVPFLFLSLGLEEKLALLFVGNYLTFSYLVFSQILFFGLKFRQLGSLFGIFVSATILNMLIFYLDAEMVPTLFLLSPPLISTLKELGAQVTEGLSSFEI